MDPMRRLLGRWRIGPRLTIGFGAALSLLVVVAVVAGAGLVDSLSTFQTYRGFARDANLVGRLQANMLIAHDAAKDFVGGGDAADLEEAHERLSAAERFLEDARTAIEDPERAGHIADIVSFYDQYTATLDQVVDLVDREATHLAELVARGDAAGASVHELLEQAAGDDEAALGVQSGRAAEAFMNARVQVQKFLTDNTYDRADAAIASLEQATADLGELHAALWQPERRERAAAAIADVEAYGDSLDTLIEVVTTRASVVDSVLDFVGPEMAMIIEDVKLSVQADQDTLGPAAIARVRTALLVAGATTLVALALGFAAARVLGRSIAEPLTQMTGAMRALAEGDLATEVPCRASRDELGEMSATVQVFKDNAIERRRLEEAQLQRVERVDEAIGRFDREVGVALGSVGTASQQLDGAASSMVSAAGQASSNVQAVATAAEEMSASVAEISHQTDTSREVANEAVRSVETASKVVHELNGTAQQITGIVDLISDIADQTNLLALNATIEAARAGDAGKGFAVVAHEVKTLAGRTGQATADIAEKIHTIRAGSDQAVQMIADVTQVMGRLDEVATAIAGAIEEQTATTTSIAQNAQEAAQGTENVVETIRGSGDGGAHAGEQSMMAASRQLGEQTERLRERVQSFLEEIRAA
jgi:methyl-accepting chemotaxis protein